MSATEEMERVLGLHTKDIAGVSVIYLFGGRKMISLEDAPIHLLRPFHDASATIKVKKHALQHCISTGKAVSPN